MSNQGEIFIVGAMSGSSLDGLDVCLCRFDYQIKNQSSDEFDGPELLVKDWSFKKTECYDFPEKLKNSLKNAAKSSAKEITLLHAHLGRWIGEKISDFIGDTSNAPSLIASHGHTVFHFPENNTTLQIGCGVQISETTGIPTITDFRKADMVAGGTGAPLAPMADKYLLPPHNIYINAGGITNLTHFYHKNGPLAWDVGPFNQLLNRIANKAGKSYDDDGKMARSGHMDVDLFQKLLDKWKLNIDEPFGMDNEELANHYFHIIDGAQSSLNDQMHTTGAFIIETIIRTLRAIKKKYVSGEAMSVIVTGGGAHNGYLISQFKAQLDKENISFNIPSSELIDFKESALMALLGLCHKFKFPTTFPTVTGSEHQTVGGILHRPSGQDL